MKLMVQDAFRYMQMPKSEYDDELAEKIKSTYAALNQMNTSKYIYNHFSIHLDHETVLFDQTTLSITSTDLAKLLKDCDRCYILAATLGQGVDRQIGIKQKVDMLEALIWDSCASVWIDKICDDIEQQIIKEVENDEFLTMRFSPGYGDVSLEVQQQLIDVLSATKKIGISLTKTDMLIPTKSITAFIGISHQKQNRKKSCSNCNLTQTCLYRKRGDQCGL